MIAYFDTSAVIPLLIEEPGSEVAGSLWGKADRVLSVRVMYSEAHAALAQAERNDRISRRQLNATVSELRSLLTQIDHIEITKQLAERAGSIAEHHRLHGYNAIHLSAAEQVGTKQLVVVAGDTNLLRGAQELGLNTAQIG
jgi:hypothetical protein